MHMLSYTYKHLSSGYIPRSRIARSSDSYCIFYLTVFSMLSFVSLIIPLTFKYTCISFKHQMFENVIYFISFGFVEYFF